MILSECFVAGRKCFFADGGYLGSMDCFRGFPVASCCEATAGVGQDGGGSPLNLGAVLVFFSFGRRSGFAFFFFPLSFYIGIKPWLAAKASTLTSPCHARSRCPRRESNRRGSTQVLKIWMVKGIHKARSMFLGLWI